MILLDEAAYASPDLVFETIFPLLEMESATFVAISTVLDQFNFFSMLIELMDEDGEPFFNIIVVNTVCPECSRLPKDKQKDCTHVENTVLPPWKSSEKHHRAKILAEVDPKAGRNARESMGLVTGDYNQVFDEKYILETFSPETRKYYEVEKRPDRLFITFDPDGGGKASMLAIASGFICKSEDKELPGTIVITGLETAHCQSDDDQDILIENHLRTLRKNPYYQHIPFILIPENQTGFFHARIERKFNDANSRTFHEYNGRKAGVCKDAVKTKDYQLRLSDMLRDGKIKFAKNWISTCVAPETAASGVPTKLKQIGKEGILQELQAQMTRYCYDEHGKLTGKINGAKDDLYIALAMLCYFSRVIMVCPKYEDYRISELR